MARQILGPQGKYAGKVGSMVGFIWKGKQIVRAIAMATASSTTAQELIRTRFGAITHLGAIFGPALYLGLRKYGNSLKITQYNAFVKLNWSLVSASTPGTATVDYSGLTIAKGGLSNVGFSSPQFDNPLEVSVDITPHTEAYDADADDLVYIWLYCPDLNAGLLATPVTRSTATATISVPSTWNGQRVYLYGFTIGAADLNKGWVSNSAYIGSGSIS